MNEQTKSLKTLKIVNVIAFVAVVTVNALSNILPLNGRTAEEISDSLPSYFTPAGYTFSIWGLIYMALLGFIIYQAIPGGRADGALRRIGWLFAATSLFNAGWLFAWHYGAYTLSVGVMLALLATLITIYRRLDIGGPSADRTIADRLFVLFPFSLYLGWITVATIANVASVANYLGWDGFGIAEPTWSAIMMSVAVVVAAVVLLPRRNLAYAGVLVWALFGIRAAYADVAVIATTALVAAVLIAALALVGYVRSPRAGAPVAVQAG